MYLLIWLANHWMILIGDTVAAATAISALVGLVAIVLRRRARPICSENHVFQPVTVLKPLCGVEEGLYDSLRSCCEQDYPEFQIVFGVRRLSDPAVAVVRQLRAEYPELDLTLVADDRLIGSNYKVSNLANMVLAARHELLVIADSDITVGCDYLKAVTEPMEQSGVGLATCLYRARAGESVFARLSAMFVNGWFAPSVLFSRLVGWRAFGFGATLVLKRAVLEDIGGFAAVADHVADDYMLGELVRRQGYETVLTNYLVETSTSSQTFSELLQHEIRQARALRVLQPVGYGFTFVSFGIPLCGAMLALTGPQAFVLAMFSVTIMAKWLVQLAFCPSRSQAVADAWLLPLRDLLSLAVWVWSYAGRRIYWRGRCFSIRHGGYLVERKPSKRLGPTPVYLAAWFRLRNSLFKIR